MLFKHLKRHFELRKLLNQSSDHTELLVQGAYAGFDPTAESLHIGNLIPILGLIHCAATGVQPLALIGSATALVGDPTGRRSEKSILSPTQVEYNSKAISQQILRIFQNGQNVLKYNKELTVVDNALWFRPLSFLDFLTNVGRFAKVSTMLSRNCVQSRLQSEDGLSFCELSYQLMQGYDFQYLNRTHNINVQIGGSDQWGNMITGVDLAQRLSGTTVGCITLPLLTAANGEKMGKSAGNGIWLDKNRTSVYDFYQYFVSLSDADACKLLPMLSLEAPEIIQKVLHEHESSPESHLAQRHLAKHITELVHGADLTTAAINLSESLFQRKFNASILESSTSILLDNRRRFISRAKVSESQTLLSLLRILFPEYSNTQLRHQILSGAFQLNYQKITDINASPRSLFSSDWALINLGKSSFYVIKITEHDSIIK